MTASKTLPQPDSTTDPRPAVAPVQRAAAARHIAAALHEIRAGQVARWQVAHPDSAGAVLLLPILPLEYLTVEAILAVYEESLTATTELFIAGAEAEAR